MNKYTIIFFVNSVIIFSLNNTAFALTQNKSSNDLTSIQETITALDVTRKKSQQELIKLYSIQNKTLRKEINEYSVFIEFLSYQIKNYCLQIYNDYGSEALTALPCQLNMAFNQNQFKAQGTHKNIQTTEEDIGNLDNEFMNSLGEFDEMLLKEEEQLAAKSSKKQLSSGNGNGNGGANSATSGKNGKTNSQNSENSAQKDSSSSGKQESESGTQNQTRTASSTKGKQKNSSKEKTNSRTNRRTKLDEIKDDIVARQLKEAAEKEPDPELKEKLWDEYYKYKQKTVK